MKRLLMFLIIIVFLIFFDVLISISLPYYLRPNIWLAYIVFVALFKSHIESVVSGFVLGVIYDVIHLTVFGVNILLFSSVGYVCGWLNKHVDETLWNVQLIVMFLGTMVYVFLYFLLLLIIKISKPGIHHLLSIISTVAVGFILIRLLNLFYSQQIDRQL
ncbi:MAG: rod shape-determining protein MreD [Endomicrobia bacterium]|nr:rod shape-determining protein MreD [Endomicrobiia bacterium]